MFIGWSKLYGNIIYLTIMSSEDINDDRLKAESLFDLAS